MESNSIRYQKAFVDAFGVDESAAANLAYQSIQAWDSVGHMALIATLEEEFDIELDIDDITSFSSYSIGASILLKYGIDVAAG